MSQNNNCCIVPPPNQTKNGFWMGLIYGLIPHSFCLAFALFSIIGTVALTGLLKKILLIPNIFFYLVIISLFFATLSAVLYLRKKQCLCIDGIKNNSKYISTIYLTTVIVNIIFFYGIIPMLVNASSNNSTNTDNVSEVVLNVDIPCSGHGFLIIQEVQKNDGIINIKYNSPKGFNIKYDNQKTTSEKILASDVFKTYKATVQ